MSRSVITVVVLTFLLVSCTPKDDSAIDVMTLNIRLDNPADSANAWPHRAPIVAGFINDRTPDLLGMQEVLWHQYEYLDSALTGYGSVAAGRDDGLQKGEACPVFYRLGRFDALANGTFWLSATPEMPGSIGWGAALTRISTWVRLYDSVMNDTLLFLNTKFYHISDSARLMSSGVLLERVRSCGDNNFIITVTSMLCRRAWHRKDEGGRPCGRFIPYSETPPTGEHYTFNDER